MDTSDLDTVYEVPFSRSPYSLSNVKAYFKLKQILKDNDYDAVHCHTPMGAVVTRLAAKSVKKKQMKVIYTAHGFHFYAGASKFNWLIFYPIEKYLSKFTDCLITINEEDYQLSVSKRFSAQQIVKVNGVGVDLSQFQPTTEERKQQLRAQYGFDRDAFIMIYPADFCERKNQLMLLKALEIVVKSHQNIKLLMPGLQTYIEPAETFCKEHNLLSFVEFMGYRRDIFNLDALADISVSSSRQEGLPINLIEAMAMGNPIVASDVRGNNDLVDDGNNGYLVPLNDNELMAEKINYLIDHPAVLTAMGLNSVSRVKKYSTEAVIKEMVDIYKSLNLV